MPAAIRLFGALCAMFLLLGLSPRHAGAEDLRLKIGLATGVGGVGDQSYNDMLLGGLVLARAKFGVDSYVEFPNNPGDDYAAMMRLVDSGCQVILGGGGYFMTDSMLRAARETPNVHFVLLDEPLPEYPPNASSVTFRQNEASFMAGALAAFMTRTDRVAFLGATDIPIIQDFQVGFEAGVKHIRPEVRIETSYLGDLRGDFNPYLSPLRARSEALKLYDNGADIIFAVASGSNKGVFAAAQERERRAIGVDSDQDHLAKGYILTSVMKRLDHAVLFIAQKALNGELENREYSLGLVEDGVALSPMTFTKAIIPVKALLTLDVLRAEIISGYVNPPSALRH